MTDTIVLGGNIDPVAALDLRVRLTEAADVLRPRVLVDLRGVERLHLAAVTALVNGARLAARRGGEVRIVPPSAPDARRALDVVPFLALAETDDLRATA